MRPKRITPVLFFLLLNSIIWAQSEVKNTTDSLSKLSDIELKENTADNYFSERQYNKSLQIYLELLEEAIDSNYNKRIPKYLMDIGRNYYYFRTDSSNETSLNYFKKSYFSALKVGDNFTLYRASRGIGAIYGEVSHLNIDSSFYYLDQAIELAQELELYTQLVETYSIKGSYCLWPLLDTNKAIQYFNLSEKTAQKTNDSLGMAFLKRTVANIHVARKNYTLALKTLKEAEAIYLSANHTDGLVIVYASLRRVYEGQGNYKHALELSKLIDSLTHELYNESAAKEMAQMKIKYETEKKEKESQLLKAENKIKQKELIQGRQKTKSQFQLFAFIVLLLLTAGGVLFYRNQLKNNKREALFEKQQFKTVIDAEEKERVRIAKELHDGLGQTMFAAKLNVMGLETSATENQTVQVDNAINLIDDAIKEIRIISHDLMPVTLSNYGLVSSIDQVVHKLNDSKVLKVEFEASNLEDRLPNSMEITLYRVIQEILNNMINHGKADLITIELNKSQEMVNLTITDNGVGFDTSQIKNSTGLGWKSVFSRISLLNGKVEVNSELNTGTQIIVSVPI